MLIIHMNFDCQGNALPTSSVERAKVKVRGSVPSGWKRLKHCWGHRTHLRLQNATWVASVAVTTQKTRSDWTGCSGEPQG